MRSHLQNRRALAVLVLVTGCAGPVASLPPDTTSINRISGVALADFHPLDATMTCPQIAGERRQVAIDLARANGNIAANRAGNQIAGYFGAFVPPVLFATEGNYADKDAIQRLYARNDVLIKLGAVKSCPAWTQPSG